MVLAAAAAAAAFGAAFGAAAAASGAGVGVGAAGACESCNIVHVLPIGLDSVQATRIARTDDNELMLFGSIAAAIMDNLEVVETGECVTGGTPIIRVSGHMHVLCM